MSEIKTDKTPMRKCIGCMKSKPRKELMRIAAKDGRLTFDGEGKSDGRGVYCCKSSECIERAFTRKGFNRSLKGGVDKDELLKVETEMKAYIKK